MSYIREQENNQTGLWNEDWTRKGINMANNDWGRKAKWGIDLVI